MERDKDFQCFGDHLTLPPLDVEIFVSGDDRIQEVKNLTQNKDVIHLSNLTPNQDYSIKLRARPSLDLSRTIYSPWLNFSIQTLPDGQSILGGRFVHKNIYDYFSSFPTCFPYRSI